MNESGRQRLDWHPEPRRPATRIERVQRLHRGERRRVGRHVGKQPAQERRDPSGKIAHQARFLGHTRQPEKKRHHDAEENQSVARVSRAIARAISASSALSWFRIVSR